MITRADEVINSGLRYRELYQAMSEQPQRISVWVTSSDGSVSAAADGLGSLTGLRLAPSANRLAPDILTDLIVETAREAARIASDRYGQILTEFTLRIEEIRSAAERYNDS